jgi:hypothetical protein
MWKCSTSLFNNTIAIHSEEPVKASTQKASKEKGVARASESTKKSSLRQRLILAFVSFHIFAIFLFAMPLKSSLSQHLRDVFAPYMRCIGMTEAWDMFAPNPKSSEQFLEAIVITQGGQTEVYKFPRMEDLSYRERYRKERYRKFAESVLCDECSGLWPDIARAAARRTANPNDPPEKVILVKFESPIDPKTGASGDDAASKPTILSEFHIEPKDLR